MESKPQVYIVDDDQAVRDALRATLSLLDADVRAFGSAEEFLSEFKPNCHSCLVLDLRMPETSGLELLRDLRDRDPVLPVILISGQGSIGEAVAAMKMGAIEFLEKPNCIRVLRDRVKNALECSRRNHARIAGRTAATTSLRSLSADELNVMEATAAGAQDKSIASRLDVSTRTVQLRRASAMKKLAIRTKADMIKLVQAGQFELPDANRSRI